MRGQIWRRVERLRSFFEVLKISHIYGETNRAANLLAGYHPLIKWVDVGIDELSPELCDIIREDRGGEFTPVVSCFVFV